VESTLLPEIREVYQHEVKNFVDNGRTDKVAELKRNLSLLRDEEARLGRLLITGKVTETTFEQLRVEWQEKVKLAERNIYDLERETTLHFDDLDVA